MARYELKERGKFMVYYYKVPKKINYVIEREYDTETEEIISETVTDDIETIQPDIPDGISWIGTIVGNFYFIKTSKELEEVNGIKRMTDNLPDNLLKSKVKGVK
jgi:hypothetical protein